jgi:hypothetical protein
MRRRVFEVCQNTILRAGILQVEMTWAHDASATEFPLWNLGKFKHADPHSFPHGKWAYLGM